MKIIIFKVNKPEAAASLLDKAGKLLEKERPEDATGLYEKVELIVLVKVNGIDDGICQHHHSSYLSSLVQAAATVSCEDRPNIAAEYMGRAGRLYVRIKKYDEAVSDG